MSDIQARLHEKVHISWQIAALCVGFIAGVAVAPFLNIALPTVPVIIIAATLCAVAIWRKTAWLLLCLCIAGLMLGNMRGSIVHSQNQNIQIYVGQQVTLSGLVVDDPAVTPIGGQRVTLRTVQVNGKSMSGSVWVETSAQIKLQRSDAAEFKGQLGDGFGTISGSMFRAQLVSAERTTHGDVGLDIRNWFASAVRTHIPSPESDLGLGYLLGQRSALPEDMNEKLQLLGLTHVVVASGYNLTILVRFARRLFIKHSKYLATMAGAGMIVSFVLITGFSPSMSRAALVTGLALAAWYYGRRIHPLVLLPFAAAVTLAIHPSYVWGDIGWYLSFVSFAGVLLFAPVVRTYFFGAAAPPMLLAIFIETMSAQIATFPITAFVFGQYSLLSLPANMLILPLVPFAMVCTFIAGVAELIIPAFGNIAALPAQIVLGYMTHIIDWLGNIPGAGGAIYFGMPLLIGSYVCMMGFVVWLVRKTNYRFKDEDPLL